MTQITNTLKKLKPSFPVRRMDYEFDKIQKYWMANDPALTHFFTGLSTLFPEGESYFVRSVRALRPLVAQNTQLDRDIGAFIGQEAMHSKEHHAFHVSAIEQGLNPESLERITGSIVKTIEKIFPKKWNLLVTVGLEHFTATLTEQMMKDANELITDQKIRNLWLWHSVEETEHRSVAFDLYEHIYGKGLRAYVPRVVLFAFSFAMITVVSLYFQTVLMKRDGQLGNIKSWIGFAIYMTKNFRILTPEFVKFFNFKFHPDQKDLNDLVQLTKLKIGLEENKLRLI